MIRYAIRLATAPCRAPPGSRTTSRPRISSVRLSGRLSRSSSSAVMRVASLMPSRPLERGRPLAEERRQPLGEVRSVGDAGEVPQFLVEVVVELVDAGSLVEERLRDGVRARRSRGEPPSDLEHVGLERRGGKHRRDQPDLLCLARREPGIEQHQLHRLPQAHEARQKESRALGAGEAGLVVRPLEARALGREHQVARHGDPEAARRGDPLDGCDERLGRPLDLRNRAVQVLEDLLEALAVPLLGSHTFGMEVAEVGRVALVADVLQVRAAAEHAALAANHDATHLLVARELQPGLAELLGGVHVHRVETVAAIDRDDPHRPVAGHANMLHAQSPMPARTAGSRSRSGSSSSGPSEPPTTTRSPWTRTSPCANRSIARASSGPHAARIIHSRCAYAYALRMSVAPHIRAFCISGCVGNAQERTNSGPTSTCGVTRCTLERVSGSPAKIASRVERRPRYLAPPSSPVTARSASWTLITRPGYASSSGAVTMWRYPHSTMRSGRNGRSRSTVTRS